MEQVNVINAGLVDTLSNGESLKATHKSSILQREREGSEGQQRPVGREGNERQ